MSTLLAAGIAVGVAVLGILWRLLSVAKKSGVDQQIAKEGQVREQDIQNVKKAADAGARVRPDDGGMLDDPYNRDRRGKP